MPLPSTSTVLHTLVAIVLSRATHKKIWTTYESMCAHSSHKMADQNSKESVHPTNLHVVGTKFASGKALLRQLKPGSFLLFFHLPAS